MELRFLDRSSELGRLRSFLARRGGGMAVLFGRRRCGKSRLIQEALPKGLSVYYVGDERDSALQRAALAAEIGAMIPAFGRALYPGWEELLAAFWERAPAGLTLAIDEFPYLAARAPELPSLLQKRLDARGRVKLILSGSSQRMMGGVALDRSAPLYGRAVELLRILPLPAGWIRDALKLESGAAAVEAFAVWGGIPRYWELAADFEGMEEAVRSLALNPLGVLYEEPMRLLRDDFRETTQASSVLHLIGGGCHRLSEIASRLGKPATALSGPLQTLVELGLVRRDRPFGEPERGGKRSLYRIDDPFLRFWFRHVAPNRSRLAAGQLDAVWRETAEALPRHVAGVWEDLARASVARMRIDGIEWKPARSWWGAGPAGPIEIDVVAESADGRRLLVGEAKWSASSLPAGIAEELRRKARLCPFSQGREVHVALWCRRPGTATDGAQLVDADAAMAALR